MGWVKVPLLVAAKHVVVLFVDVADSALEEVEFIGNWLGFGVDQFGDML
jgi:hypothetical protein